MTNSKSMATWYDPTPGVYRGRHRKPLWQRFLAWLGVA